MCKTVLISLLNQINAVRYKLQSQRERTANSDSLSTDDIDYDLTELVGIANLGSSNTCMLLLTTRMLSKTKIDSL